MNEREWSPVFPLGLPLLPGNPLPLQIFELRYRMMLDDCLGRERPGFAVTMIERGSEVGGGDVRSSVGTWARVVRADPLPGDRWMVLTVGTGRVRVEEWLPDDPYPRARIVPWPDDDRTLDPRELAALDPRASSGASGIDALAERVRALLARVGRDPAELAEWSELRDRVDASMSLYQLAARTPCGAADRQRLLEAPGFVWRMSRFHEILDDLEAMTTFLDGE